MELLPCCRNNACDNFIWNITEERAKMKKFIEGVKEGQKYFGENIAIIVNSVLLSLVYIIGIGIVSITAKIFKKEFLDTKISTLSLEDK